VVTKPNPELVRQLADLKAAADLHYHAGLGALVAVHGAAAVREALGQVPVAKTSGNVVRFPGPSGDRGGR
jgi:hypothetical protein